MKMVYHLYLIRSLNPIFKPLAPFIAPETIKLLVYAFGELNRIWSDERAIVVVLVPPDGAKRLIS